MEEKIIADTDVIIDLLETTKPRHLVTKNIIIDLVESQSVCISSITEMELIVGVFNKAELKKMNENLKGFQIIYTDISISKLASKLMQEYNLSHGLQIQDSIIAATSLITELPLFTYNTKDYKFIKGIKLYKK